MLNPSHHRALLACVLTGVLFAAAYYQLPLFAVNQNTYFLQGLAQSGYGLLATDWLGNQTDHIPLFSALVGLIHQLHSHWLFHGLLAVMAGLYAIALLVIASRAQGTPWRLPQLALFLALLVLLHSAWLLKDLAPAILDRPAQLLHRLALEITNGVAGQTILGAFFQPSTFGVLLPVSVACFVLRWHVAAIVTAVLAASVHPTYVLHAGALTAAYMLVIAREGQPKQALWLGLLALALVLPILIYVAQYLKPTSPELLARAQSILAEERIPHHALIADWFNRLTWLKLAVLAGGLAVARRDSRLFTVLALCTGASVILSAVQAVSGSHSLALIFPWRLSTWLVPICIALLLGEAVTRVTTALARAPRLNQALATLALAFVLLAAGMGLHKSLTTTGKKTEGDAVAQFAASQGKAGQIYLLPLEFYRFRLAAGLPVFIDWKSHPYRDVELIEWYDRTQLVKQFYGATTPADAALALTAIQAHAPVTHLILKTADEQRLGGIEGEIVYRDEHYVLVKLGAVETGAQLKPTAPRPFGAM